MISLAFTVGYAPGSDADATRVELAGEAIRLARLLRSLLPRPELDALLERLRGRRRSGLFSEYALQALIGAEHAAAARAEDTRWDRIAARYAELAVPLEVCSLECVFHRSMAT